VTPRLLFRPEARTEILEAQSWYDARVPGLGTEFALAVAAGAAAISRFPDAYPLVHGRVRKAVLRRFPYALLYVVDGGSILIIACYHHRRDPRGWQSRA
jgi:plasmid stabilization system protein ParE